MKIGQNLFSKSLYVPLVIGLTVSIVTLVISALLENQDNRQIQQIILTETAAVKSEVIGQLKHRILALERMAKRWEAGGGTPQLEWEADAKALVNHQKGYQAIEWVDSDYYVRWIIPKKGNEAIINLNAGFDSKRREALEVAKNRRRVTITRPIDLVEGDKGFLAYVPLFLEQGFDGFILGVFKIQLLLDYIFPQEAEGEYGFTIFDEDNTVIYNTTSPNWKLEQWSQSTTLELYGVKWRLEVVPSPELLNSVKSPLPEVVKIVGLILGWILALVVYLAFTSQHRARQLVKAEKALQKTLGELKLQKFALDRAAIVLITDPQGKITYVNDKFCQISQYDRAEILGKTHRLINSGYHPPAFFQELWSTIASGQVWQGEIKNRAKDGSFYWVDTTIVPFFNSENKLLQYLTIRFDITTRKQGQEQLQQTNIQLEQRVTERTAELAQAKEKAEAANQAKSTFIAHMSHEFRTPLNGILGFAQILQQDSCLTPRHQDGLQTIQECGSHLLTLIGDILDLAKIEAEKLELKSSTWYFDDLIKSLVAIIHLKAQNKGIVFYYQPQSSLPTLVQGDQKRLRQVLLNLLSNAIKFTKTGSVTFQVSYVEEEGDRGEIPHSSNSKDNRKIRFQVEDTGIGIPPEKLADIFIPFHQAVEGQFAQEGTGLGLTISQNIVRQMGGEIQVESTLGQGSVFWFEVNLPEIKWEHRLKPTDSKSRIIGFRGQAQPILVVDDQTHNRAVLVKFLSSFGFEVVEAANGEEGLTKAQQYQPGLIFMDLVMPVLDGFETTRRLRQEPNFQEVAIIATSASILPQEQILAEQAGCNAFLSKPIDFKQLLEMIAIHLQVEWIYEQISPTTLAPQDTVNQNSEEDSSSSPLVAPPDAELALLLELAKQGNIARILERVAFLEQLDSLYLPFAQRLRQLAESFQEIKLRQFIERQIQEYE